MEIDKPKSLIARTMKKGSNKQPQPARKTPAGTPQPSSGLTVELLQQAASGLAAAIQAIKELSTEVETLKAENAKLRNNLEASTETIKELGRKLKRLNK